MAGATQATVIDGAVVLHASGPGLLPRVIAAADQAGITATDLAVSEPSLETVFISLTGKDLRE